MTLLLHVHFKSSLVPDPQVKLLNRFFNFSIVLQFITAKFIYLFIYIYTYSVFNYTETPKTPYAVFERASQF